MLFHETNIKSCDLFYCPWCGEFGKKSKFHLEDSGETTNSSNQGNSMSEETINLSCTKCNKYLIKENQILTDISKSKEIKIQTPSNSQTGSPLLQSEQTGAPNFTLKEVLKSFKNKTQSESATESVNLLEDTKSLNETGSIASSSNAASETNESLSPSNVENKLKQILSNSNLNQITKSKLDELNSKSKRINNNLKLYLIINVLGESEQGDDTLVCMFNVIYFFNQSTKKVVQNCVCVFTSKQLIVFEIINQELFEQNVDFEKCLNKLAEIEINQIEIIELAQTQNYLVLECVKLNDLDLNQNQKNYFKFVTNDIYLTQAFLNSLLSKT